MKMKIINKTFKPKIYRVVTCMLFLFIVSTSGGNALSQEASLREKLAFFLAVGSIAEITCGIKGESMRAKNYVDSFRTGFDTYHNQADGLLLFEAGGRIQANINSTGKKEWCNSYLKMRRDLNLW
ncbi:hypothetical protein [Xanthobacter autotrophicus]|uniref:hypothetical protein n=1 Tax=Xanthobacter autotrophicus TaxID=280 RepID=UPI0037288BD2